MKHTNIITSVAHPAQSSVQLEFSWITPLAPASSRAGEVELKIHSPNGQVLHCFISARDLVDLGRSIGS